MKPRCPVCGRRCRSKKAAVTCGRYHTMVLMGIWKPSPAKGEGRGR